MLSLITGGKPNDWKAFFPEDGEVPEDAFSLKDYTSTKFDTAQEAAKYAARVDYEDMSGHERNGQEFRIGVISPDGKITYFIANHEESMAVYHVVEEDENQEITSFDEVEFDIGVYSNGGYLFVMNSDEDVGDAELVSDIQKVKFKVRSGKT